MRWGWVVVGFAIASFAIASCGIDARGTGPTGNETTIPTDAGGVVVPNDARAGPDGSTLVDGGGGGGDGATLGPYTAAVLADAPIAYWRLEELGGPSAADERAAYPATVDPSGGFARAGALSSQPSRAIRFDGASTSIKAAAAMPFDGTKPFTIEAWIKPLNVDGANRWFFVWGDPSGTLSGALELAGSNGNIYFVRTAPSLQQGYFLTSTIAFGVFTHLVVTYDGTTQTLYKDGVLAKSADSTVSLGGPAGYEVRWGTRIGSNFYKFEGDMDELALYDKALSAARVKAHFDAR